MQGDADDGVPVPGRLEQQALPGGPGVPGLDPDSARVAAEQRVEVLPQVGVVPGTGGQPVAALGGHRAEDRETHRGPAQDEQVRRGGVVRVRGRVGQPVKVAEVRPGHAEQPRDGVHPGDEGRDARAVGLGQGIRGVGTGRQHQRVEQLAGGELVPRPQARVARVVRAHVPGHRGRDGDRAVQVTRPDHQIGGHHLGDAGHRAFGVQASAPQQPAGGRILDRGRPRGDAGRPGPGGRHEDDTAAAALAAGAGAPSTADAASAVPASSPHTRMVSRHLVPIPLRS